MSIIPSAEAGNIVTEKNTYAEKNTLNTGDPWPYFTGTLGENGWYISCVTITFTYDPERVAEIWYRIDEGSYQMYEDEPIVYCNDGEHVFRWYWVDYHGEQHPGELISFKLDQTPPTITLSKKSGSSDQVIFTATVNDPASGVEKVEFYLDDELQDTVYEKPYKWTWTGTEEYFVYAIGYNYAGLSEKSNTLSTPYSFPYYSQFVNKVFQIIYHMIFWNQQFI